MITNTSLINAENKTPVNITPSSPSPPPSKKSGTSEPLILRQAYEFFLTEQ
jgi:hypothetical protein